MSHLDEDSQPLISTGLKIAYLILALPASMTIGALIAQLLTANISNFEGGSGYAWVSVFIISAPLIYIICLVLLPLFIKKYPTYFETIVVILGFLSLGLIGIINM